MTPLQMKVFVLFVVLFIPSNGRIFSPDAERDIRAFVEASMKCHHIPGMTLSVVKDDEVWTQGFGKEDFSTGKSVDQDSLFGVGSITKAFTATLLGILITEKNLTWTSKVTDILGPEFEFIDPYRTKELTLRDLLSHRTGLARLDFGLISGLPPSISTSTFCKNLKHLPEERPIRDGFIYNNMMFMMLGHVTEVLGGDTWQNLVTSKLFKPIGMASSKFITKPDDTEAPHVARPYIFKDGEFQNGTKIIYDLRPIGSAGAVATSANDMAKWMKFNLKLGQTETGEQLIDKKLMQDMRKPVTSVDSHEQDLTLPEFPAEFTTTDYGYAWFVSTYREYRVIQHGGGLFAYISLLWTFPDMNMGVFISVNGPSFGTNSGIHDQVSAMYVVDHLLGLTPWLNASTACSFPEPWKPENNTESDKDAETSETSLLVNNKTDYVGSYGNHLFADVKVFVNSSTLLLNSNHIHGILHPYSEEDKFFYEITFPWEFMAHDNKTQPLNVTFQRDAETGKVTSLVAALEVDVTYVKGKSLFDIETRPSHVGINAVSCNGHDHVQALLVMLLLSLMSIFSL